MDSNSSKSLLPSNPTAGERQTLQCRERDLGHVRFTSVGPTCQTGVNLIYIPRTGRSWLACNGLQLSICNELTDVFSPGKSIVRIDCYNILTVYPDYNVTRVWRGRNMLVF